MIKRTDSKDAHFIRLVSLLDKELADRDGDAEHAFYDQFNKIDTLKYAIVAYQDDKPVGCGAIKQHESGAMEVKRMYVLPEWRGKGISALILGSLEDWARELSFKECILETGKRQFEAVKFYQKNGYESIPNYGQYIGIENSLCFKKNL